MANIIILSFLGEYMRVILKSYRLTRDKQELCAYVEKLKVQGWQYNISEGGCISPDRSTIFVDFRDPYYGQLMCCSGDKKNEYENTVNMFLESGDFVEIK